MEKVRERWEWGRWRRMSWRADNESEKRAMEQGEERVKANLRPSRMAKSSAVRIEAMAGNLQAVARVLEGT